MGANGHGRRAPHGGAPVRRSGRRALTRCGAAGPALACSPGSSALTFGSILGFLATIFAGWLGGLLVVDRYARVAIPAARVERIVERRPAGEVVQERVVRRERPTFRLLPVLGRKGGQRAERKEEVTESRVERG